MKYTIDLDASRNILSNVISHFTTIPKQQLEELIGIFNVEVFPKKSIIIAPDTKKNKMYFIVKGLVRIYYESNDKQITSDFKEEFSIFINGYTLFTKLPNIDSYVAMEDTVCLVADYEKIEELSSRYHAIEHLGRKMVESYYASFLKSNYNNLFLSAEDRYDVFVRERSAILNRVPLRFIASHLGFTPETLSRLRSKQQTS